MAATAGSADSASSREDDALGAALGVFTEASSDEQRLAGLLLATRVGNPSNPAHVRRMWRAIGTTFPRRLLQTKSTDANFHMLALSLIGTFTTLPEAAEDGDILALVPILLDFAEEDAGSSAVSQLVIEILEQLAAVPAGRLCLLKTTSAVALLGNLAQSERATPDCVNASLHLLCLILYSVHDPGFAARPSSQQVLGAVEVAAAVFAKRQDEVKFAAVRTLVYILEYIVLGSEADAASSAGSGGGSRRSSGGDHHAQPAALSATVRRKLTARAAEKKWLAPVRRGLYDILRSKVGPEQRSQALCLAALLCELDGFSWALGADVEGWESGFARILVHLTCVELRMGLEDVRLADIENNTALLSSCLVITEAFLCFLAEKCHADGTNSALPMDVVLQLQAPLNGAIGAVIALLRLLRDGEGQELEPVRGADIMAEHNAAKAAEQAPAQQPNGVEEVLEPAPTTNPNSKINAAGPPCNLLLPTDGSAPSPLVTGALRLLGAWLAEETESLREEVADILPFVLELVTSRAPAASPDSLVRFFLSAIPSLCFDDGCRAAICNSSSPFIPMLAHLLVDTWLPRCLAHFKVSGSGGGDGDSDDQERSASNVELACSILLNLSVIDTAGLQAHSEALCACLSRMADMTAALHAAGQERSAMYAATTTLRLTGLCGTVSTSSSTVLSPDFHQATESLLTAELPAVVASHDASDQLELWCLALEGLALLEPADVGKHRALIGALRQHLPKIDPQHPFRARIAAVLDSLVAC
eukprot:m.128281 g.128281  ORF g.128281 m.128281 type:complete len:762 (-) comp9747_c0_seq2:25-2310(-)